MKKFFRKVISILMVVLITISSTLFFAGCSNHEVGSVTRGEWLQALSQKMGFEEYQESKPYFKDIKNGNSLFPAVQSCYEWGVLVNDSPYFYQDFTATKEFIAETIVRSSTLLDNEKATKKEILSCAVENNVITSTRKSELKSDIRRNDINKYLDLAYSLYTNKEFVEYEHIEMLDTVKPVNPSEVNKLNDNTYSISNSSINVGDVIVVEQNPLTPTGIAKKVKSVEQSNDGNIIVETEQAKLEEICSELEFAYTAVPTADNIQLEPGVTLNADGGIDIDDVLKKAEEEEKAGIGIKSLPPAVVTPLGNANSKNALNNISNVDNNVFKDLSFNYSLTDRKVSVSPSFDLGDTELRASISGITGFNKGVLDDCGKLFEDKSTFSFKNLPNYGTTKEGWEKTLYGGGKFEGSYNISVGLKLSDFAINTELKTNKFLGVPVGIKSFKASLACNSTLSTTFEGSLSHEIKIGTTPIPVGPSGISININFYVLVSAEGVLTLSIGYENELTVEYANGNWRKTQVSNCTEKSIEVAIDLEFGPAVGVSVAFLGVDIIDVRLDVQGVLTAKASAKNIVEHLDDGTIDHKGVISLNVDFYAPTISLEIGTKKTLANKIGLTLKWDAVTKEKAPFHIEIYNKEWILFEENVEDEETEETTTDLNNIDNGSGDDDQSSGNNFFSISTYAIELAPGESQTIEATLPKGYTSSDVSWTTSDSSVATVSNGTVTAKSEGVARITASFEGTEIPCTVMVVE